MKHTLTLKLFGCSIARVKLMELLTCLKRMTVEKRKKKSLVILRKN